MQRLTIGNHLLSMPHSSFEIFQRYTSSRIKRVKLEDTRPGSTHHRFILGMLLLKCNHRKPKRSGKSFMKLKAPEPSYKEIEATYGRERQRAFRVEPIIWLQLEFLRLQYCDISTNELYRIVSSQQKIKCLGMLIPKPATSTKQWEISTTHTACCKRRACLGANVDTYFCNTFHTSLIQTSPTSLWAQFMYYIIFYSFKHDSSPCNLWGN